MIGGYHRKPDTVPSRAESPGTEPSCSPNEQQQILLEFLQDQTAMLLRSLHLYVIRAGLASGEQVQAVALDILQETVVEALAHAERFHVGSEPLAWILGIAVNLMKRRKRAVLQQKRREVSLHDLGRSLPEEASEADVLDALLPSPEAGPEQIVEADEQAQALLGLVSSEDQQVLSLALLSELNGTMLAAQLGTSIGTARMRLHRALNRLRLAWRITQETLQEGATDE